MLEWKKLLSNRTLGSYFRYDNKILRSFKVPNQFSSYDTWIIVYSLNSSKCYYCFWGTEEKNRKFINDFYRNL